MLETKSKPTNDNRLYKLQECGDSFEYKTMVDKWRRFNGLEPLYERENKKQVTSIG